MQAHPDRYFEDFAVGDRFVTGSYRMTPDEVEAFARAYDPQPFHLDPVAAERTIFGQLVASGWHTMACTMRLLVDSGVFRATGISGTGVEELRWPKATQPGAVITAEMEVLSVTPSRSKPDRGTIRMRVTSRDETGEAVLTFVPTLVIPKRPQISA